ncbi:AraC family transcriptional regulator [Occultella glacieicola]|uniref:AraC family transcriptional regulator n=1 Tax=Occultella glacieicola TaxID=2518684 RepID=A0ABY2E8V6_9MICO|nr:helix-turn-helix domain-containing protein [Occultella glacieicola]TDE98940.1 AraC family transcriptional regulator [Occultella glacieicola]
MPPEPEPASAFVERAAPADLAGVLTGLWFVRTVAPTRFERILPATDVPFIVPLTVQPYGVRRADGWHLLRGPFVAGLTDEATISSNGGLVANVGARLRPDALRAVGLDPQRLAGGVHEVDGFPGLRRLRPDVDPGTALDAVVAGLRDRLEVAWRPDPVVRTALASFGADPQPRVGDVATRAGVSAPALVARFRRACGVTPKAFADLQRLHGLLERLTAAALAAGAGQVGDGGDTPVPGVIWSELAAAAGYYDQSHLTRAFHRFVGLTPTAYFDRVRRYGLETARFVPEQDVSPD